jgi:hypothetical protein
VEFVEDLKNFHPFIKGPSGLTAAVGLAVFCITIQKAVHNNKRQRRITGTEWESNKESK